MHVEIKDNSVPWARVTINADSHVAVWPTSAILHVRAGDVVVMLQGAHERVLACWVDIRAKLDDTKPTADDVRAAIEAGLLTLAATAPPAPTAFPEEETQP